MSIHTLKALPMVASDEKTTLSCKADLYAGHESERAFWDTFLTKRADGQTLLGLVEATAVSCDMRSGACARVPETFQDIGDIVAHALITIHGRELLGKFDSTRGNGEEGFPGYVKSCVSWVTRSHITDTLRHRSRTPSPEEAAQLRDRMREEGAKDPKVPTYVPATLLRLLNDNKGDEGNGEELGYHGSCASDWSTSCTWSAVSHEEADSQASMSIAYRSLMSKLTGEEADAIRQMLAIEDEAGAKKAVQARRAQHIVTEDAAPAVRTMSVERMRSLVKQARHRFEGTREIVLGL